MPAFPVSFDDLGYLGNRSIYRIKLASGQNRQRELTKSPPLDSPVFGVGRRSLAVLAAAQCRGPAGLVSERHRKERPPLATLRHRGALPVVTGFLPDAVRHHSQDQPG